MIWSKLDRSVNQQYSVLQTVGHVPIYQPLPYSRKVDSRFEDGLFEKLPIDLKEKLAKYAGPYYHAVGDHNSYFKSVKKMDVAPKKEYLDNPMWDLADEYLWDVWFKRLKFYTRVLRSEELLGTLNLSTSPGVPLTSMGFHKKKDVVASPWGVEYLFKDFPYEPLWRVVAKEEWYHQSDLLDGKIRTFIIPPFKFLNHQKVYYHTQNEALKEYHWSAYGFNPYYGGVDRLARRLIGKGNRLFGMYDVKGWDRLLNFLRDIYALRYSCHSEEHAESALWVGKNTCRSKLLLADGYVVEKNDGNNSGSNNTTSDNILCHEKLLAYFLLRLVDGDVEQLQHVVSSLFGDDNVFSIPLSMASAETVKNLLIEVFAEFGYVLDPIVISTDLTDMEFLGFKFGFKFGHWLPFYKVERIMAGFCYEYEKRVPPHAQISKAFSLLVMLWPHGGEVYETACDVYSRYLSNFRSSKNPTVLAYIDLGVPTHEDCLSFYTGSESGPNPITPLFMFNLEVGGFKNE